MEANINPAQLLQWYSETGVDEAIGHQPVNRTAYISEKSMQPASPKAMVPLSSPATLPIATAESSPAALGAVQALADARALATGARTLAELKAVLEGFQGLPLKRTATQMVFADGVPTARVMLVGETPGADEDRIGRPFVGESGQLLDKMLAAIGLSREENVYITNIINWRPPGNRDPSEVEVALSLPFVHRHIELINPAVLVCVGGVSAKALLRTTQSITRLRGKWMDYSGSDDEEGGVLGKPTIPALALFHPAYLLRLPAQKGLAWADLLMLKARLQELHVIP